MATADQLRALARHVGKADFEASRDAIERIAERLEQQGKARLAEDLHSILAASARQRETSLKIRGGAVHLDEKASFWFTEVDVVRYSRRSVVLSAEQEDILDTVITEQRQAKHLRHYNLEPVRRLLLCGPPGTGKSLTAAVLAAELQLPLRRVNLHALISRYLGETAQNIAKLFEEIEMSRAVYLFDEFDGISRERYSTQDSGEMDRVVNTLLQLVENDTSSSLLIGTTNAAAHIDSAFARRFDEVIPYGLPDGPTVKALVELYLPTLLSELHDFEILGGLSHADIAKVLGRIHKDLLLSGKSLSNQLAAKHVARYKASQKLVGGWNTLGSEGGASR